LNLNKSFCFDQAQGPAPPAVPEAQVTQYNNLVLAVVSNSILTGNFTAEQQPAVQQVLDEAGTGLQNCESTVYWQYKKCSALVLRTALTKVKALQLVATPPADTV
jgi:hypothetical protein